MHWQHILLQECILPIHYPSLPLHHFHSVEDFYEILLVIHLHCLMHPFTYSICFRLSFNSLYIIYSVSMYHLLKFKTSDSCSIVIYTLIWPWISCKPNILKLFPYMLTCFIIEQYYFNQICHRVNTCQCSEFSDVAIDNYSHGTIKLTHNLFQGATCASLDGKIPYTLPTWLSAVQLSGNL